MRLAVLSFILTLAVLCDVQEVDNSFSYASIQAKPYLTHKNSQFGAYIEGASVDRNGNIYAVNYGTNLTRHQFGQIYPVQKLIYGDKDKTSLLASSKFYKDSLYLNEAIKHKVYRFTIKDNKVNELRVFCNDNRMIQPNDLTISDKGIVYLSGNVWNVNSTKKDGDLWSCTPQKPYEYVTNAKAVKLESLGRTNGIELSYDQKYMYLSESINLNDTPNTQKIYRYNVNPNGTLNGKILFKEFKDSGDQDIDGMKTDIKGNLYVTRNGGSKVIVLHPQGQQVLEIKLSFSAPTNLEFGGKDGKTLFVVGQCNQYEDYGWGKGCVDTVELPYQGSQWTLLNRH